MSSMVLRDDLWNRIVSDFRRVCVLRKQGQIEESNHLMSGALPMAIAQWSRQNPQEPSKKKASLAKFFQEEQQSVEDAWAVHQLFSATLTQEIIPTLRGQIVDEVKAVIAGHLSLLKSEVEESARHRLTQPSSSVKIQPRIKFDDLPEIIDALHAEEQFTSRGKPSLAPRFASQVT